MKDVNAPFNNCKDPGIPTHRKESVHDCHINPRLQLSQRELLTEILEKYEGVFNDLPGTTATSDYHINLID